MFLLLLACAKLSAESDSDVVDDTEVPIDRNAVWTPILLGTFQPLDLWQQAEGWRTSPPSCPSAVANGDTTTFTGPCTDGAGVAWSGVLVRTDISRGTRLEYQAFTATNIDTRQFDGEIVWFRAEDRLDVDLTERDAARQLVRAWTSSYHFDSAVGARTAWARAGQGAGSFAGRLTAADGLYEIAGTIAHDQSCGKEPDRGEVRVSGFREGTLTFNGTAICDGCVPLADEYGIGDICPFLPIP